MDYGIRKGTRFINKYVAKNALTCSHLLPFYKLDENIFIYEDTTSGLLRSLHPSELSCLWGLSLGQTDKIVTATDLPGLPLHFCDAILMAFSHLLPSVLIKRSKIHQIPIPKLILDKNVI